MLGAVLSSRVGTLIRSGLSDVLGASAAAGSQEIGLADLADAPAPIRAVIRVSYGDATGRVFLIAALLSLITIVAVLLIREVALRTETGDERLRTEAGATSGDPTADVDAQLAGRRG